MTQNTYVNPVYAGACPDPFVLKHAGEYWCYCTGIWEDGRAFGILNSPDLVHWRGVGGALDLFASLDPLPDAPSCYWAPEVTYYNGQFYLYYSIGNEDHMQIRVALSQNPAGPFIDSGRRLTKEDFAIDPHIYQDNDGAWYMFYATDYLNVHRVGTGTTRDLLLDPFTLAGQPRPVTRAQFDWQIYDPNRAEKGGVRWHTIEGPFVLQRKGRYYQMFSGGNWQNSTYGVSYALSFRLDDPEEWDQAADGEQVLPILRTSPDRSVIGPGQNSVVR